MRGAKIVDTGEGFFLVQFASTETYNEAMLEGPWTVLGSYLQVQSWSIAFRVQKASPLSMAVVWIRISDLPLHLYPPNVIIAIGGAVENVMKVDYNTSGMQRGKFARLAVNVDLTKPLVSKLTIDGKEFKVEYENLQELCFYCGMYGQIREACVHRPKVNEGDGSTVDGTGDGSSRKVNATAETYGLWMVGEKKRKSSGRRGDENGRHGNGAAPGGSRFDILKEDGEVGRDDEVHASVVGLDSGSTRVEEAAEAIHNSKNGTPAAGNTSYNSFLNSEGSRRFKLGKNSSVRMVSRVECDQGRKGIGFLDASMMEPVVVSQETATLGRPPDEKGDTEHCSFWGKRKHEFGCSG